MATPDPASAPLTDAERRGPLAYMVRNRVAANLLMAFIVVGGLFAARLLVQEVFPETALGIVSITVPYPGASPEEVEEGIVVKIEEQIDGVEGLDGVRSTAAEGLATVSAEMKLGTDAARFLDDVKAQVDRIQTFPQGAERPEVREVTTRQSVLQLAVFGDVGERTLKEVAFEVEEALSALPEVSHAEVWGVRDYEISIEVPEQRRRALGLSLQQIAALVRAGSRELSAGSIDTPDERVRVRTTGQRYSQQDFENIVILNRPDGTLVRLGDIAVVRDGFEDVELLALHNGQRAAYVEVYRTSDERVLEIADAVGRALDEEIVPALPAGVSVEIWDDTAAILESRLGLMLKNGAMGLALVLLALSLFLETRLAFWVAVGIAVSFLGALPVMHIVDASINVMSLLGFILAIGLVVDDAIVVGENIHREREKGMAPVDAAMRGARRIGRPVVFAVLTTMAAFAPLLFIPGSIGAMIGAIPVVVIAVLVFSLVESLLILPHHIAHAGARERGPPRRPGPLGRAQMAIDAGMRRFTEGPLDRALRFATGRPQIVIASAAAVLIIAVATVPAGIVPVVLMPEIESERVTASLTMPEGSPADVTRETTRTLEERGRDALEALAATTGEDLDGLLLGVQATVGQGARFTSPRGEGERDRLSNLGSVQFRLVDPEGRRLSAADFEERWRDAVGPLPEARSVTFTSRLVELGAPVHVELSHRGQAALRAIGDTVMARLAVVDGVFDVASDNELDHREMQLDLLPEGSSLGLTVEDLAAQVRSVFFGVEAVRVQRGREEVRAYVRAPGGERDAVGDLEAAMVHVPGGGEVRLSQVASAGFGRSPSIIRREDGRRVLSVTASVDEAIATGGEVTGALERGTLSELSMRHPELSYSFGGEQRELSDSLGSLVAGFALAMLAIYALLAIPFGSYTKPVIIMAAIPFALVGGLLGHVVLGMPLAIISLFGMIGLSGVIVNDSLMMIDHVNERQAQGMSPREAVVQGAKDRFRPILLTSITTFLGVAPLVFEGSVQAQFLKPLAAALGFGILFGTAVLMVLVPSLAIVHQRVLAWRAR